MILKWIKYPYGWVFAIRYDRSPLAKHLTRTILPQLSSLSSVTSIFPGGVLIPSKWTTYAHSWPAFGVVWGTRSVISFTSGQLCNAPVAFLHFADFLHYITQPFANLPLWSLEGHLLSACISREVKQNPSNFYNPSTCPKILSMQLGSKNRFSPEGYGIITQIWFTYK